MFKSEFLTFFIKTYPWEFPWLGLLASTGGTWIWSLVRKLRSHKPCSQRRKRNCQNLFSHCLPSLLMSILFPLVSQIKSLGCLSSPTQYMISHCVLWMIQPSEYVQNSMTIYHFYCFHLFPDTPIFWIIAESTDRTSCFYSHLPTHTDAVSAARVKLGDSCYFPA